MLKWLLILLGIGVVFIIAIFLIFGVMVWKHERGFPKSILADTAKGACFINTQPVTLVKFDRSRYSEALLALLPESKSLSQIYGDYEPGSLIDAQGNDMVDLDGAIEIAEGTRFRLRDGFMDRTLNTSAFHYWLEPEGIAIDGVFLHYRLGMGTDQQTGEGVFYSIEDMASFPETDLFRRCPEG